MEALLDRERRSQEDVPRCFRTGAGEPIVYDGPARCGVV